MRMLWKWMKTVAFLGSLAIIGGMLNVNAAPAKGRVGQLSAKAHSGRIAVRSDRGDLPAGASLTMTRQKDAATLERVQNALNKRKGIKSAKVVPSVLAAYDISIDEGKTAWQPTAGSPVRVTVTLDEPVAAAESANLGIVHIADDGTAEALDASRYGFDRDPATKAVTGFWVDASGFSIYAITEAHKIATFTFYKGDSEVTKEYVLAGEGLYDPGLEEQLKDGETFSGWSFALDGSTGTMNINELNALVAANFSTYADKDTPVYAMIEAAYYVRYYDWVDGNLVQLGKVQKVPKNGTDTERTITVRDGTVYGTEEQQFRYWLATDGTHYTSNQQVELTGSLDLYVTLAGRYWLVFLANSDGDSATYTPPQLSVQDVSPVTMPAMPKRTGYAFTKWTTNADGTGVTWDAAKFTSTPYLTDDVTLYAQWEGVDTDYYVVFWKQSVTDEAGIADGAKTYDYAGIEKRTAKTGTEVSATTADIGKANSSGYEHFKYNSVNSQTTTTVIANGTSTLNIYYDRETYTLTFTDSSNPVYVVTEASNSEQDTQYGYYNGQYVRIYYNNGTWYRSRIWILTYIYSNSYSGTRYIQSSTVKTITALYQHSIADQFPIQGENGITYDNGERWSPQGSSTFSQVLVFIDVMPAENITFNKNTENHDTKYMHYYVEALPGATTDHSYTYQGTTKYFVEYCDTISANYNFITEAEDYVDLVGYSKWTSNPTFSSDGQINATHAYFYYTRDNFTITFESNANGKEIITEEALYQSDLSVYGQQADKTWPVTPTNGEDGYAFVGWYNDADGVIPFDFNSTMPNHPVKVYAKWENQRVRAVLDPDCDDYSFANNQGLTFRLDHGERISGMNITGAQARRIGYKLDGWYTTTGQLWNFGPNLTDGTRVHLNVEGVNMNYQSSTYWTQYGDNDGAHDNVKGILFLKAKWVLDVESNVVYVRYKVGEEYKLYTSGNILQTVIPVDTTGYSQDNPTDPVSFTVAAAPSNYRAGFKFAGWALQDEEGNTVATYPAGGEISVDASYITDETITDDTRASATIKVITMEALFNPDGDKATMLIYNGNGGLTEGSGEEIDPKAMLVNQSFALEDGSAFTRAGYTFVGWTLEPGNVLEPDQSIEGNVDYLPGGTTQYGANNESGNAWDSTKSQNILYARWRKNSDTKYKVKRYLQNDDDTYPATSEDLIEQRQGVTEAAVSVTESDKAVPSDLAIGYELDTSKDAEWSGNIEGDGSLELKVYLKQKRCQVMFHKFDSAAPDLATEAFRPQSVHKGFGTATRPSADPTWTTRNAFQGWMYRDPDGPYEDKEGYHYSDYDSYFGTRIVDDDIILYAKWAYKVTFVLTGEGSNMMKFSLYLPFGDQIPRPGVNPQMRPGYTCIGWTVDDDETGTVHFETDGASERVPQDGVTFRPKWVADEDITSAQQFMSPDSTYGMIAGISTGSAGATTLSAKGRTLLAPTAQTRRYTVKHAVYAAYPYYTVLKCDDLNNPVWTAAEDSRMVTGVGATAVDIPVEGKRGFFRLLMSTTPLTKGATKLGE